MAKLLTLADYRKRAGLTQEDVAKKVGITQSYYSQVESGLRKPSIKLAELLARELNTKWQNIYNGSATK